MGKLKIMKPIDLFKVPEPEWTPPDQLQDQQRKLIEQFIMQFDKEIEQKLSTILVETGATLFQLLLNQLTQPELVIDKLRDISSKLTECRKLTDGYLVFTKIIDTGEHKKGVETLSKITSLAINLIHTVTTNNPSEQEIIVSLTETCENLSKILSEQKIEFIKKDSIHELLEIIDQTGIQYGTDTKTLLIIKDCVKHVLWHENPREFLITLAGSAIELMQGLQEIRMDTKYNDLDNIELIKACITKFLDLGPSTKEYVLQLGCELLKLGDAQSALEVFSSTEVTSPEFLFDKALALVELGGKDNYINAKYQLEQLIKIAQTEMQIEVVDLDKVRLLLVTTLDKLGQYGEAKEYYEQISLKHQPETIFENFLLLKYQYNFSPEGVANQVSTLIRDEETVINLLKKTQDADFWYLAGMGYVFEDDLLKANECFKQAISTLDTSQSMLITEKSYPIHQMLHVGTINRDSELVKLITKYDISKEIQKDLLFEFVRSSDVDSVNYLLSQGIDINITTDSKVTALHIACESNNLNMVNFLLSQGINFDTPSILNLTPLQAAAIRVASEDGNEDIIKVLLQKYQETKVDLSDSMLLDIDFRLQHGPDYIETDYRNFVQDVLGRSVEWSHSDSSEISW